MDQLFELDGSYTISRVLARNTSFHHAAVLAPFAFLPVASRYNALDHFRYVAYSYIMKQISYTKAAIGALRRMPANSATLIRSKIEAYARDPASQASNVRALKGREGIRLRVGDWRVIMDDQGKVLAVLAIGPRGSVYD